MAEIQLSLFPDEQQDPVAVTTRILHRSFKYRLFTNVNQERELEQTLETHRRLYNKCLDYKELIWQCYRENLSFFDMSNWLTHERRTNPFLQRVNRDSAAQTLRRLDKAFQNFYRTISAGETPGYPQFKGKNRFSSFTFLYNDGAKLIDSHLRLQHIGTIKVKLHRPVEGKIKTVTVKREAGKWYVIFDCEVKCQVILSTKPATGIDVGLESFLTTSTGEQVENPRFLKKELPKLRRVQRSVSRKKKGGKNRRKAVKKLQKIHVRVRNLRNEYHHKIALSLVRRYGFIAAERLNIKGMVRNSRLSRAIQDAGWSSFLNILHRKAEHAGVQFVLVDPKGTSQVCSQCGATVKKDLSVRRHDCPACGLSLHRDHNSALEILKRGLAGTLPAGLNVDHQVKRVPRSRKHK